MAYTVRFLAAAENDIAALSDGEKKAVFDKLGELESASDLGALAAAGAEQIRHDALWKVHVPSRRTISIVFEPPAASAGEIIVFAVGFSPSIYETAIGRF